MSEILKAAVERARIERQEYMIAHGTLNGYELRLTDDEMEEAKRAIHWALVHIPNEVAKVADRLARRIQE